MSSTRQQKEEFTLSKEFLEFMDYEVLELASEDKPDVRAVIQRDNSRFNVGIEIATYQVDAGPGVPGGSPGVRLHAFWSAAQRRIRELLKKEPTLKNVHGLVFLKRDAEPPMSEASAFADELVHLASASCPLNSKEQDIRDFPEDYPLLRKYAHHITLCNVAPDVMHNWECSNVSVSSIGVEMAHIVASVYQKKKKSQFYDRSGVDEVWLLICAQGYPIVSTAGPEPADGNWDDQYLQELCATSGFDRVYFWERMYRWCKEMYPSGELIQKEWRAFPLAKQQQAEG